MPTFKAIVREHQQRKDGKYPVSIRVIHNRKSAHIHTGLYVTRKQISKHWEIKDQFVLERTNQTIREYERRILQLGTEEMREMPIKAITAHLTRSNKRVEYSAYCERLIAQNGLKWNALKNALLIAKEVGYEHLMLDEVDDMFLSRFKKAIDEREVPVSRSSKSGEMKKLSAAMKNRYLEQLGQVYRMMIVELGPATKDMHLSNPFERVTYYKKDKPKKGSIPVEDLIKFFAFEPRTANQVVARDLIKMSFCLGGMNFGDLMLATKKNLVDGYLRYQRHKTKDARADGAWTAIKIQPEIEVLVEKYKAKQGDRLFDFGLEWDVKRTAATIWNRVEKICQQAGLPMYNPYLFRHTVASIARNKFRYSRDDVGMLLNHRGPMTVDDVYIDDDWSINDEINRKILDYVFGGA